MVRISVLHDALKTMYNAEKRGKRQVLIRPSSKVVIKFLQVMMKHGEHWLVVQPKLDLPHMRCPRCALHIGPDTACLSRFERLSSSCASLRARQYSAKSDLTQDTSASSST